MNDHVSDKNNTYLDLATIALSFLIAFFIQLIVHESGHYIAGLLSGATEGHLYLHPFYNSKVIFMQSGGKTAEIITGIAGPILDLVFATLIGIILWNKNTAKWLPFLMWGSIAFIGEGIGMLSSIAVYPEYIEDMTQLVRIGVPIPVLTAISILLLCIGLIWLVLVMPMAGIHLNGNYLKRFFAYLCCLPFYFGVAFVFIKLFKPIDLDTAGMRLMQLEISAVLALILTLLHQPINSITSLIIKPKRINIPNSHDVILLAFFTLLALGLLFSYYGIYNN